VKELGGRGSCRAARRERLIHIGSAGASPSRDALIVCVNENIMPKQPFWFFLTWISILWYAYLVFHVGWKGFHDIRRMTRDLESKRKGEE
jgi:hypothetical protein